jgi:DNA primase
MVMARAKTAVLVEGYLDLIALAQVGVANAVATCGTAFTPEQARLLRRGARKVVMLFDGDRAGRKAAVRSSHVCLAAGLEAEIATLPTGVDPADLVVQQGADALHEVLRGAVGYLPFVREAVAQAGDDRAALEKGVHQVLTTIAEVPDAIRREYMLQEAADLFGLDVAVLRGSLPTQPIRSRAKDEGGAGRQSGADEPAADLRPAPRDTRPAHLRLGKPIDAVNAETVERQLLSLVLLDEAGTAAGHLVDAGARELVWSAHASLLIDDLVAWADARGELSPRQFVETRWNEQGAEYRNFVTDLLASELYEKGVPPGLDLAAFVANSVARLRSPRRVTRG